MADFEKRSVKRLRSNSNQEENNVNEKPKMLRRLEHAGEKRQVVYVISDHEDSEHWSIGIVVPYDELDSSMDKKPKGKQIVVRMFEDNR